MKHGPIINKATRFSQRFPRLTAFFLGGIFCILLLLCIEGICSVLNMCKVAQKPSTTRNYAEGYYQQDNRLGYKPKASLHAPSRMIVQGKTVYDVVYSIDEHHRRVTPQEYHDERMRYVLFFGGSFTFGEGVEDNQTLPAYFSQFSSDYNAYNYGFHGYGPHQMLARLQIGNLRGEIPEPHGLLIYVYLPFHIKRAIGDMYVFNKWGKNTPYYTFDTQQNLTQRGSFWPDRRCISLIYHLLGKSNFVQYFGINFPLQRTARHFRLTSKIIEESQKEFQQQFTSDFFYVLLYPREEQQRDDARKIIPYLESAGISYLDYTALFDPTVEGYRIRGDGHPSSEAYKILAKKLSQDLSNIME